jgi:hypothetical protein
MTTFAPARSGGTRLVAGWLAGALMALPLVLAPRDAAAAASGKSAKSQVPGVARALAAQLEKSGRAEALFERSTVDPLSGKPRTVKGRIALEPPDRVALELPASGERITVREDGGEWLQPRLSQMIVLGGDRASAAMRWWSALLPSAGDAFVARDLGGGRWLLVAPARRGWAADTARVTLDGRGLPARLEITESESAPTVYRISNWRFSRPRGRAAFVLQAPAEYEVVNLK